MVTRGLIAAVAFLALAFSCVLLVSKDQSPTATALAAKGVHAARECDGHLAHHE
jgi:hypothetical protein